MPITIATCQFPTGPDIGRNLRYILRQMRQARRRGADVAHFSETCLSGYAGAEFESFAGYDWQQLREATEKVLALAGQLRLWVILGSSHRLTGRHRPHNCLYVIDDRGRIVDRYDKVFCTGPRRGGAGDLEHYSPGCHMPVFRIGDVTCGTQICYDARFPELYREYSRRGVRLVFHSYHNGHKPAGFYAEHGNIHGIMVPATMRTNAANNAMWISVNNTCARESAWPSFTVRPDGRIHQRLRRHRPGVLITTIDPERPFYDASRPWRDRAMAGVLHSGRLVTDPRSDDRRTL